jgi:hypothetical protein
VKTRWAGIQASGKSVRIVAVDEDKNGELTYVGTETCPLQDGDHCAALEQVRTRVMNSLRTLSIQKVALLDTAAGKTIGFAHLQGAELRGVVKAAASAAVGDVVLVKKGVASRTFGARKVDGYVADAAWFGEQIAGPELSKVDREVVFCILAARKPRNEAGSEAKKSSKTKRKPKKSS